MPAVEESPELSLLAVHPSLIELARALHSEEVTGRVVGWLAWIRGILTAWTETGTPTPFASPAMLPAITLPG
jgi:hypothetical protein